MRDLEAREALCYMPPARAIQIATEDAEVCGDIQHPFCVIADDVIHREVTGSCWRRERRRSGLHVQVRERAGARAAPFNHVEDMARSGRRHGVVTDVRNPSM